MSTSKTLDRKTFLTSSVAALATVTLGGCGESSDGGGTDNTGGSATGGTATGGTAGSATGGTPATGGSAGVGGSAGAGVSAGAGGTTPTGGTGGTGGTGSGGDGGSGGGGTRSCMSTMTGDHMHPLNIPPSDIERGFQDAPYILQEGGTGHTHTLVLDPYEFVYLNAGVAMEHESSTDAGHSHVCTIDCPL